MKRYGVLFSLMLVGSVAAMEGDCQKLLTRTKSLRRACDRENAKKQQERRRARRLLRNGGTPGLSKPPTEAQKDPCDRDEIDHALFEHGEVCWNER